MLGGMRQPPFPFVLVALTGLFVWIAVTSGTGWLPFAAWVGAGITGAAALYQSRPQSDPHELRDPEELMGEPEVEEEL